MKIYLQSAYTDYWFRRIWEINFISYGLNKKEDKRGRHVDDRILRLYSLSLSLSPSTVVIDASLWDRPFMTPCVVVL